jgi:hypothetical protein
MLISSGLCFSAGWAGIIARLEKFEHRAINKPSIIAEFLLYVLLSKKDRETIPGDLYQEFTTSVLPKFGALRAWLWYWFQVIRTVAYRNVMFRWLLIGGGIFKIGDWITRNIG